MKNTLSVFLVLAIILGLFAACGSAQSAGEPAASAAESVAETVEEPATEAPAGEEAEETAAASAAEDEAPELPGDPFEAMKEEFISYPLEGDNTISIFYYIPPYVDFMDSNYNFNAVDDSEAATGVKLEFQEVGSTTAAEQFNLMVAGGDMTDLIPVREYYSDGLSKAYEEDIIIDIGEYVDEYMPNYAAVLDCLDEQTVKDTMSDGMTLAFSTIADGTYSGNGLITRGDWLEEQGVTWSGDTISLDEFTDWMRTIHENYGTSTTYYLYDGTMPLEAAFDTEIPVLVPDGFMNFVTSAIFRKGDEVQSGWTSDGYREYLEWLLQMFDEGIMEQDFLSLDSDRQVINFAQGSGDIGVWTANADKMEECIGIVDGQPDNFSVAAMPNVTKDPSETYVWAEERSLVSTNGGFSISASCDQPELVCQWQNYFWTYDGWLIANYGVEGESLKWDGDTPTFDWQTPVTVTGRNAPNAEMAQNLFTMMRFVSFYSDNDRLLPTFPESALAAVDLWTIDAVDERNYPSAVSGAFTVEENEAIAQYEADLLTYAQEQALKFMTGALELTDANWSDYVDTCNAMGLPEIVAVYQNAYNQYLAGER